MHSLLQRQLEAVQRARLEHVLSTALGGDLDQWLDDMQAWCDRARLLATEEEALSHLCLACDRL